MKYGNVMLFGKHYRNIVIIITVVIVLVICIILKSFFFHPKQQTEEESGYKSYTSIEIRPGDSLWSIASEHMTEEYESVRDYVKEIKSLNDLKSDEIHAGKFLLIPYYVHQ